MPTFALRGSNRIPLERGLGSSAAACVAGIALAAWLLALELDAGDAVRFASEIEGHQDNAAAAVHGGFAMAMEDGSVTRFDPHPDLRPVVLIPDVRLPTEKARRALPDSVPRADAVFNAGHAALAVLAFIHRPDLLAEALQDRLHQPFRLALVPTVAAVFEDLRDAGVPVCVSGAGPTLLAFDTPGLEVPTAAWPSRPPN